MEPSYEDFFFFFFSIVLSLAMITFGLIYILIFHIRCVQIILKIKYKISQFSPCGFTLSKIH
jgi:hypothetical protein